MSQLAAIQVYRGHDMPFTVPYPHYRCNCRNCLMFALNVTRRVWRIGVDATPKGTGQPGQDITEGR